jgi:hypothetical protein
MELHEILHYSRKKKKHTLISLSEVANIPYGILYRLETGKIKKPHPHLLKQISVPLELDYAQLLLKSGYSLEKDEDKQSIAIKSFKLLHLDQLFSTQNQATKQSIDISLPLYKEFTNCSCVKIDSEEFFPVLCKGQYVLVKKMTHLNENSVYMCYTHDKKIVIGLAKKRHNDLALYSMDSILIDHTINQYAEIIFCGA